MNSYAGTTTLVTGASKGIGTAYARELAARGSDLVLLARSAQSLESLAAELRSAHGVRVDVLAADLFQRDAPREVAEALAERGIVVDLLVNNAGMGAAGPFLTRPYAPNVDSVDLNVIALMGLVHGIGAGMLERGAGGIINVASVAGFQPMPFQASYAASKAFVLSFTEALAEEVRGTGIRVMAVHPGPVATGFFDATTATTNPKAVSAERIARRSLDDFARGRTTSFPGARSDRGIAFVSRLLTRRAVVRLSGDFNRKAGLDHVSDLHPAESIQAG
jgi:short-subunit dehydrogenase